MKTNLLLLSHARKKYSLIYSKITCSRDIKDIEYINSKIPHFACESMINSPSKWQQAITYAIAPFTPPSHTKIHIW